jgi:hypothetical protein
MPPKTLSEPAGELHHKKLKNLKGGGVKKTRANGVQPQETDVAASQNAASKHGVGSYLTAF